MPSDPGTEPDRPAERIADTEIEAVIDHYDDPSHPDSLTVDGARGHLEAIQTLFRTQWESRLSAVRSGDLRVAVDTGDTVVFHDPTRRAWDSLLDEAQLYDSVDRTILRVVHHQAGCRLADAEFDGTDPIVVAKPPRAEAGQQFVEAVIASLSGQGLSLTEAWAYYGIELREYEASAFAEKAFGGDRIALADAVERARETLQAD